MLGFRHRKGAAKPPAVQGNKAADQIAPRLDKEAIIKGLVEDTFDLGSLRAFSSSEQALIDDAVHSGFVYKIC